MSRFPPQTSVLTPIRMTRTAYAQLSGQKFHPPKVFGQFKREGTPEWKWRDIGMKIVSRCNNDKPYAPIDLYLFRHVGLRCCIRRVNLGQKHSAQTL